LVVSEGVVNDPIPLSGGRGRSRNTAEKAAAYHAQIREVIEERYDARIAGAELEVDNAEARFESVQADEKGREPQYWRPPFSWLYWFFLAGLALAEVPVNRLSFQLFFAESPAVVLAVAALVGVVLIVLAHAFGMITRRFRHSAREAGGAIASIGRLLGVTALILGLCYGVAIFRQAYLAFATQPNSDFTAMLENDQLGEAALIVLQSSLAIDGLIFMLLNLVIVGVGVLLAFYRHDPHPNFEDLDRGRMRAAAQLKTLRTRRGDELAAEDRRYANECRRKGF
jgi:hypothetical protein